jgi:DNA-binding NarL/FixJ family response regulator
VPDVLLLDLEAGGFSAARVAREISKELPRIRLVALSSHDDQDHVRRLFAAGFHRHISKGSGVADLLNILLEDHVFLD